MGILSETLKKHKNESGSAVQSSDIAEEQIHAVSAGKEIDWEERHFQICLAMLSCPVCNRHGLPDAPKLSTVIVQANKMVELLKKNSEKMTEQFGCEKPQTDEAKNNQTEPNQVKKKEDSQKGIMAPVLKRSELFSQIWDSLKELGYDRGSDIRYFDFNECCEGLDIDVDTIDIEEFSERYEVNIG